MTILEQKLLERIARLQIEQQQQVLAFVEQLSVTARRYSARELMRLPLAERNAILHAQLVQSNDEDFETFEAYSEDDIDATV